MDTEEQNQYSSYGGKNIVQTPTAVPNSGTELEQIPLNTLEPLAFHKRWFILEPLVLVVYFAINFVDTVFKNQLLYQSCIVAFNYTEGECRPLLGVQKENTQSKDIESKVQPYVDEILMACNLIQAIVPAILSLFMGPWSDIFGRRPIILVSLIGYFLYFLILSVLAGLSTKTSLNPWLYVIASVALAVGGGSCSFLAAIYAYIADVADGFERARRFLINEASLAIGEVIGSQLAGTAYDHTNTVTVFSISATLLLLTLIYVFVFVRESLVAKEIHPYNYGLWYKIHSFFGYKLIVDLFRTSFKRREGYNRAILWGIMFTSTMANFISEGESNVTYLSLRARFNWTTSNYSMYNGLGAVLKLAMGVVVVFVLKRRYGISNMTLALFGLGGSMVENLIKALAGYAWELYLGLAFDFILTPMLHSILSLVAPVAELGKVFALMTAFETISSLGSVPLYTAVYNATLNSMPGAFYYISMSLNALCLLMVGSIYWKVKSLGLATSMPATMQ